MTGDYDFEAAVPGRLGGLSTTTHPALIGPDAASDLDGIDFDRRSAAGVSGSVKMHRDLPKLAGMRLAPLETSGVAKTTAAGRYPYALVPYHSDQVAGAAMQLDLSFRIETDLLEDALVGSDQTQDPLVALETGKVDAPPGGEFQFFPLLSRGGSDVEALEWVLGLAVVRPEGYGVAAQVNHIRPVFYWWDDTAKALRFCGADTWVVPRIEYHLSVQLPASGAGAWYLNGRAVSEIPTGDGASLLPSHAAIGTGAASPLYFGRLIPRDAGKWPDAPLMRGLHDLDGQAGSTTLAIQNTSLQTPGATNASWVDYYVRCLTGVNHPDNLGAIRRIASYDDALGRATVSAAFPATLFGEIVDVVPPMEATGLDVTVQEARLWRSVRTASQIAYLAGRQIVRRLGSAQPDRDLGSFLGLDLTDLIGYWPLSDDGGAVIEDRSQVRNHGWFASAPGHPRESALAAPVSLDGERTAVALDLKELAILDGPARFNLGASGAYRIHLRATYQMGREIVWNGQGAIEDCLFETLADLDDPSAQSADPAFSLRIASTSAGLQFYFVFHDGERSYVVAVPRTGNASLQPRVGVKETILFGIQKMPGADDHRLYLFALTQGIAEGWTAPVSTAHAGVGRAAPIAAGKTRLSFGASVVGVEAQGAGPCNAALLRLWEVGFALRPLIGNLDPALITLRQAPLDPWTSLEGVEADHDVEPTFTPGASTLSFERNSTAFASASGGALAHDLGFFPAGYLLVVPSITTQLIGENKKRREQRKFVHVETAGLSGGTLSSPWDEESSAALEARVASYLAWTDLTSDRHDFPLVPIAEEDGLWGLSPLYEDRASCSSCLPFQWSLALVPSQPGIPQAWFRPRWDAGLVVGWEPVRGIGQLKVARPRVRELLAAVRGSLYEIDDRWREDTPFVGADSASPYSLWMRARNKTPRREREASHALSRGRDQRTSALPYECVRVGDGASDDVRLWLPNNVDSASYWRTWKVWVKVEDLAGRHTLLSRVALLQGPGNQTLVEDVNCWWWLENGAMVFETRERSATPRALRVEMKPDAASKALNRQIILEGEWVHLAVAIGANYQGNTWLGSRMFVNGQLVSSFETIEGAMLPADVPDPALGAALLFAYGNLEPGITAPSWNQPRQVHPRWSLAGGAVDFLQESTEAPPGPFVPTPPPAADTQ